jgi:NAD(P)-dependent dehydrogenase (short-subunit alcohol dehydrogenase family)
VPDRTAAPPIAVITGAAAGIGQAIAIAVGARGGTVFNIDIDAEGSKETERAVSEAGGRCRSFIENAGNPDAIALVFSAIAKSAGHIDLLVNNAAVWNDTSLTGGDYDDQIEAFQTAIDSCMTSAFCCALAAVPLMAGSADPNIVNLNTEHLNEDHYLTGYPATGYDCAKFGLWRLTESWAVELADNGIRVNGLCFGAVDTPMLRAVSVPLAEIAMKGEDIGQALFNIFDQGPGGDTGQSHFFGFSRTPREASLEQIARLAEPSA